MILNHMLGLFSHPDQEWEAISKEPQDITKLYTNHILLLAAIPAIAGFIGTAFVGWNISGDTVTLSMGSALMLSLAFYLAALVGVFILGQFIDFMAATFGVKKTESKGVTLAAYVCTPLFLAGVALVYPSLWFNVLVALVAVAYSVYLLYEGLPIFMHIPPEKGFVYASSVLTVGLVMLVSILALTVIVWSIGIGPQFIR